MAFDRRASPFVASLRWLEGIQPTPMGFVPIEDDPIDVRGASRDQLAYYAWLRSLFHKQQDHDGISEGYARLLMGEILTGNTFDRPSLVATLVEALGWIGRHNLESAHEFAMLPLIANARTGSKTPAGKVAFKVWRRFGYVSHPDLVWEGVHQSFRTPAYKHTPITTLIPRPDDGWPLEGPQEVGSEAWRAALHEQVLDTLDRTFTRTGGFFTTIANQAPTREIRYRDAFAGFVDHDPGLHGSIAGIPAYTRTHSFYDTLANAILLAHRLVVEHLLNAPSDDADDLFDPAPGFHQRLEPDLRRWLERNPPPGDPWWLPGTVLEVGTEDGPGFRIDPDEDALTDTFGVRVGGFDDRPRPRNERILERHTKLLNEAPATRTSVFRPSDAYGGAHHLFDLDSARVQTYLTWREGFRRGEDPEADPELLQVHMVEIVNQLGYDTPEDAYEALKRIVRAYRATFHSPWLLERWLIEYVSVFPVNDTPDDAVYFLYETFRDDERMPHDAPEPSIITVWNRDRNYDILDRRLLLTLTGYDMEGTKYGREHGDKPRLLRVLQAAMRAADEHFQDTYGKTVAQQLLDEPDRYPSSHAFAYVPTRAPLKGMRATSSYRRRRLTNYEKLIGNTLKYAENLSRKKDEARGQRHLATSQPFTAPLQDRIYDAVETVLTPPPEPIRITIDHDHLHRLETDSATLRERLLHDTHLDEDTEAEAPPLEPTPDPPPPIEAAETPASIQALGIDDEVYQALLEVLEPHELRAVTTLARRDPAPLEAIARDAGIPLSVLIDQINEHGLEHVGDTLIDTSTEPPELIEEHAEILAPLAKAAA